jgi:hypothetical protein
MIGMATSDAMSCRLESSGTYYALCKRAGKQIRRLSTLRRAGVNNVPPAGRRLLHALDDTWSEFGFPRRATI